VRLEHSRHYSRKVIFNVILQYYEFYRIDARINFWKNCDKKASVFLFEQQLYSKSPKLIFIHGQSLKLMYFNKKFFKTI